MITFKNDGKLTPQEYSQKLSHLAKLCIFTCNPPSELHEQLLDLYDTVDDRNAGVILCCFAYVMHSIGKTFEEIDAIMNDQKRADEHLDQFLHWVYKEGLNVAKDMAKKFAAPVGR